MNLEDQCGVLGKIVHLAREEEHTEHGALAVSNVFHREGKKIYCLTDYCMISQVGGAEEAHQVIIPAKLSYVFLQNCSKQGNIPVIIHTHGIAYDGALKKDVSFSPPDMRFIERFAHYAAEIDNIPECLFIVTDGESAQYCRWELGTMEYLLEEERFGGIEDA